MSEECFQGFLQEADGRLIDVLHQPFLIEHDHTIRIRIDQLLDLPLMGLRPLFLFRVENTPGKDERHRLVFPNKILGSFPQRHGMHLR